jgi:UDP-N-acetylmuramate dehydrogenase
VIVTAASLPLVELRSAFGARLRLNEPLARYTSSRIGGSADALVKVSSVEELAQAAEVLWRMDLPFFVMGGGSNMLVSDAGAREVVILNKASQVTFDGETVWAESGASFGVIARQAAAKGLGGLEWAAGIPGTLGGAITGNAGAHGGDVSLVLDLATILHREGGKKDHSPHDLSFGYRESWLKHHRSDAVLLSAKLKLAKKPAAEIRGQMDTFLAYRRLTQPPGASMGSMFKNPTGKSAGRLIEEAGLKGTRIGNAQISPLHGNFFLNLGDARSADVHALILQARQAVKDRFGVDLELEVGLVGEW